MARGGWTRAAGWAVVGAAGLGAGVGVFSLLGPARRAQARDAVRRAGGSARETIQRARRSAREKLERAKASARDALEKASAGASQASEQGGGPEGAPDRARSLEQRPGLLGALLVGRAVFGGGLLRIPFGLLGLSTLARAASASDRGQAAIGATTRSARALAGALRSVARREGGAQEQPA